MEYNTLLEDKHLALILFTLYVGLTSFNNITKPLTAS